ncbi:sugar ABC transporter substrate-binding protein [Clostridium sp. chh4-2]|uniref:extracellular solute-binding protein n=1 Tax=Clostridium sp. chh4-2 TaxID=2067550 RepID=UPI000CCE562D|nr:extracellular solute-binding protein [Clostridium sp. chh4-2]PNV59837.1 sugar ABC transporter substrate-binding protein [Clostridium sp. chh4-2]
MKKRATAIGMAAILGISCLTGCGNGNGAQASAGAQTSGAQEQAASQTEDGVTEIEFWHSISGELAEKLGEMTENFNNTVGKEKKIKVTTVYQNWPGTDKLVTVMQAKDIANHPDLIQIYGENMNIVRDYERMVWVEDYINRPDSAVKKEDLVPNAAEAFSIDGKMLGAPLTLSTLLLYYNQDMFEAAGIDTPPATIAQMAEDMTKLTQKEGDTTKVYGLNLCPNSYELNSWIAGQGEVSYFGDNESGRKAPMTKVIIDENGTLDSFLTQWDKVIRTGGLKYQVDNMNEEFANQQHAMVIMSSARIQIMKGLIGDTFKWSVADLPKVNESDNGGASVSGGGLFMINKDDPKKLEASWEFIQYCLSPETQLFWSQNTGYVPVNEKTYDLPEMTEFLEKEPELKTAIAQIEHSSPMLQEPYYPNAGEIKTVVKEALILFAKGDLSKEDTAKSIIEGCNAAINDYYRANPLD